ncbi:MAG: AMP-binding protein [Clostridia bacterium]|nr:AMP-binding protein [Clostridia bacterium]
MSNYENATKTVKNKARNTEKIPYVRDLKELLVAVDTAWGDKPFYHYKENGEIKILTRHQLRVCVDELGTAFSTFGIMGSNIAVIGEANPFYMAGYFAAANGGGAAVPLDKELDDEALSGFATIAKVKAIVYTPSFNKRMPALSSLMSDVDYFIPISPDPQYMPNERFISLEEVRRIGREAMENGDNSFTDYKVDPEKMACLIFTSGTTGTSKGVMLSHKNLSTSANACIDVVHFDENSTFVSVLPMNHSYEVTTEHLALNMLGASTYLNDSIKNALRNFQSFKPNSLILVPLFAETIHKRIWKEIRQKKMEKKVRFAMKLSLALRKVGIDISAKLFKDIHKALGGNVTNIICGGAALSPEITRDFNAWGIVLQEGYGITECSPLVAVNRYGKVKPGSVGTAVPGCEVKIDAAENETTGEILVRGDNVMMGYYNNPEATAEVMTEDGWFRTGDLGYIDRDGFIFITGRKKNLIILSNGKNIFPEELEEHLSHEEVVCESVVVGRANADGNIAITAVIYPNPELTEGLTPEEIQEKVKEAVVNTNKRLPTFKHIQTFDVRDNEFEKTTTKKIKRFLVK